MKQNLKINRLDNRSLYNGGFTAESLSFIVFTVVFLGCFPPRSVPVRSSRQPEVWSKSTRRIDCLRTNCHENVPLQKL